MVVGQTTKGCQTVVIGGGPGGYSCAIQLAMKGRDVILIEERASLGGVCLNEGCIPSKALIHAADLAYEAKRASEMGIEIEGLNVRPEKMVRWKDGIVKKLTGGVGFLLKKNGAEVIRGRAQFVSDRRLSVMTEDGPIFVDFDQAVIATGTVARGLESLPEDGARIFGSLEALSPSEIPPRLAVVGGGYIGLELGTVYAKLGSKVTVVEFLDDLLPGLDRDVVEVLVARLIKLGVDLHLGAEVKGRVGDDSNVALQIEQRTSGETFVLEVDAALVTVGREPNTRKLGMDAARIERDEAGYIRVNSALQTTAPGIYAIGDVAGGVQLAHKAYKEAKIVAESIVDGRREWDNLVIPAVMYTDPEVATVGMSETEAIAAGIELVTGTFPFSASGRAMTLGDTTGFAKVLARKGDERIIGASIVGRGAGELISEMALAIEMGAFLDDVAETIHPHPTMSEGLHESVEATLGLATHILNPK